MNRVTIKAYHGDGLVEIETYNTDTDAVGGFILSVFELWRWLWEHRPCQVFLRGRDYWLPHVARSA